MEHTELFQTGYFWTCYYEITNWIVSLQEEEEGEREEPGEEEETDKEEEEL